MSKVGPGGHPFQKQKKPSDQNEAVLRDAGDGGGLVLLHERLVGAAAEIEATTTSSRNRNNILCT